MRFACLAIVLLAGCSEEADPGDAWVGAYRGPQRDALCIAREGEALEAGLITYGDGDTNCSFNGRAEVRGNALVVMPHGDSECSVEIRITDGAATLGRRSPSCTYYCGPDANYAGRELRKTPGASTKIVDFAGDSLC